MAANDTYIVKSNQTPEMSWTTEQDAAQDITNRQNQGDTGIRAYAEVNPNDLKVT